LTIEEFRIVATTDALDDLKARLKNSRLPQFVHQPGWQWGANENYMREFMAYWLDAYDWGHHAAELNQFPHFRADIDGRKLHFIHARSSNSQALPLVLTHGWPGSIYEFHKIIEPLLEPQAYGGDAGDAFHVICPSMTGYAWSEALTEPGCDIRKVAERQCKLMKLLGYERYGVQGGDWGGLVSPYMAIIDPKSVVGVHVNLAVAPSTDNAAEAAARGVVPGPNAMTIAYDNAQKGYAMIQGLMPDQLAYALNDSPVGLAAWIVSCFEMWGDCHGNIESRFSKDELLTHIMIYWLTGSMPSAIRLYQETMASGRFGPPDEYCATPTGVAQFNDIFKPKKEWAERSYNITQWEEFDTGGHFAALEEPEILLREIRRFFQPLR
jgi:microsomal epoxide hydrolase